MGHRILSASAVLFFSPNDNGDNSRRMAAVLSGRYSSVHCVGIVRAFSIEIIDME